MKDKNILNKDKKQKISIEFRNNKKDPRIKTAFTAASLICEEIRGSFKSGSSQYFRKLLDLIESMLNDI